MEGFSLTDTSHRQVVRLDFDPRGLRRVDLGQGNSDIWTRPDRDDVWHYREWQWWSGHPWGDSCRPRYWTTAEFSAHRGDQKAFVLDYRIDGFDYRQTFLMPETVEPEAPYWDVVVRVRNASGQDVEEYGQFFACYTPLNRQLSFWFWDASGELELFADRGVEHLDGYVVHPLAYFLADGAIPHCPRGDGKVVGTWHRPLMVSHASPEGRRSVILVEEKHACSLAQGIRGRAMDYILFPGPDQVTFAAGEEFSVHLRHYMLESPELPTMQRLSRLWDDFETSHASIHQQAEDL